MSMLSAEEKAALRDELRALDAEISRLRRELQELTDDLREGDEGPTAGRAAIEQQLLVETLEARRDELRHRLGEPTPSAPAGAPRRRSRARSAPDIDEDALASYDDDPRTVAKEGRGEDVDPAVWPEEWVAPRGDQISEAADVDDPVEALEVGALAAATEADTSADPTELADRAAPPPPEEAALSELAVGGDEENLTVGVPPGVDLDQLDDASLEDLVDAELAAIDAGDPEMAAILADEIERRRNRGERGERGHDQR